MSRRIRILVLACFAVTGACRGQSRAAGEDAVLAALVDSLRAPVERAAGLTFRTPPRSALRSREQVRAYLIAKLDEELPPARMRGLETAAKNRYRSSNSPPTHPIQVMQIVMAITGFATSVEVSPR